MRRWRRLGVLGLAGLLALAAWPVEAATPVSRARRVSGSVTLVDLGRGIVMVEELAERGRRVHHEIALDADTPVVSASRLRPREMRGPQAFGEVPVSAADLLVGDFVVVEWAETDGQWVVRRITIVETAPPARR